jgi:2,3-bisphosphoglycerate-independent phosphoglycerate mutase
MDGRDTPPHSGKEHLENLEKTLSENGKGKIATVCGRYYAMDRDKRWERLEKAYRCLIHGEGNKYNSAAECMEKSYAENVTDEFILPSVIEPQGLIKKGDCVFFMNFRPDRAREITLAMQNDNFDSFPVETLNLHFLTMTAYAENIHFPCVYRKENLQQVLSQVVSEQGLKQFKTAETEKYAHVTYFLNGGREEPFPGEDRHLVPSPKVATYDLQPEMSAYEVTENLLAAIRKQEYDLMVVNYANPDMVGHTGVMEAAVKAVLVVDECVKKVTEEVLKLDGKVLITADHGNLDQMIDPVSKQPYTAHSLYPVDFILISPDPNQYRLNPEGKLADIAPTILDLMGLKKPEEMDGISLLEK